MHENWNKSFKDFLDIGMQNEIDKFISGFGAVKSDFKFNEIKKRIWEAVCLCRSHGLISDREIDKVSKRFEKLFGKNGHH